MRIPHLAWITAAALAAGTSNATEEMAATPAKATQSEATSAASAGRVDRSALTGEILDREPQGALEEVSSDRGKVFYFTELADMTGEKVVHRWEHRGEVVAEIPFEVGSTHWRTWSSKDLDPGRTGQWSVSTVDASGKVLDTRIFMVVDGASGAAAGDSVPAAPAP